MSNSLFRLINQIFRLLKPIRARFVKLRHASSNLDSDHHHHQFHQYHSPSSSMLLLNRLLHYRNKESIARLIMFICSFCELFLLIFILLYAFYQSIWLLFFVAAGVLGIFYNNQDLMVFVPNEPPESRYYIELPTVFNLPYEVIDLITSDQVKLHTYLIKQVDNLALTQPTIVLFHGNAGNIGQRLMIAHYFYTFCACNVFMVEYRGFGLSEGSPSEKGFYLDAEAAINHLLSRQDIDTTKIIPYGQSIGGAVVINLSLKYNEKLFAFIVENTFSSLPDIGRELFQFVPGINYLPDICFKNQFQSKDKIKFITLPGLFINGTSDTMIPPRMTKMLYDRSSCSMKRLLQLEGGDHNNTWLCPGYFQFISKFIQEIHIAKNPQMTKPIGAQVWYINSR